MMTPPGANASPFIVDRLSDRYVMLADPDGIDPVLSVPFLARERSARDLRGAVLAHCCEVPGAGTIVVPPSWVSACPENVLPFRGRP